MKSQILASGRLLVEAETQTEAFALQQWINCYRFGALDLGIVLNPAGESWDIDMALFSGTDGIEVIKNQPA
jgi:hypothetical protein